MHTPTLTPAIPNESASPVRFRDRVRARTGTADVFQFALGDEHFAIDVRAVEEVLDEPEIFPVPSGGAEIAGVSAFNGGTLTVVRTAVLLGVESTEVRSVLVLRGGRDRLGLLVEDVDEVTAMDLSGLANPPWASDDLLLAVHWDGRRLTSVLDARALVGVAAAAISRGLS